MKITVDLNVLLDVAQSRLPHYHASEEVLRRARTGEYEAVLPGHAITTLHYIIEKWSGTSLANQTIDGLLADFVIHPSDKTNFQSALRHSWFNSLVRGSAKPGFAQKNRAALHFAFDRWLPARLFWQLAKF
jgi:hypothetical protein